MFMIVFTGVGLCVFAYQQQVNYFFLFAGMALLKRFVMVTIVHPAKKTNLRRIFQLCGRDAFYLAIFTCGC